MLSNLTAFGFTDARANLSAIMDDVINQSRPVFIRRKRNTAVLLDQAMLRELLSSYELTGEIYRDTDGTVTVSLDDLDIVENAPTEEEAVQAALDELCVYAQDYMRRLPLFLNAPNRKQHYPFVLRVLLAAEKGEIKDMVKLRHA